jgi:hypothetical protein
MNDQWEWGINEVGKLVKYYMTKAELDDKYRKAWEQAEHRSPMEATYFEEQDYFAWVAEQPDFEQITFTRWTGAPVDEDSRVDVDAQVLESTNRQFIINHNV